MKKDSSEKFVERGVWALLIFVVLLIATAYVIKSGRRRAQDSVGLAGLPLISQVTSFEVTNHLGRNIRLPDLLGRVWVADVLFTRCPGPCVQMTRSMNEIRNRFLDREDISWLSITTDPEHDTPEVLNAYATQWAEHPKNWHFVTGSKSVLKKLAVDDLKLVVVEKDEAQRASEADLFLHSTKFVLLDRHGRLRGIYEGTEASGRETLARDLRILLGER